MLNINERTYKSYECDEREPRHELLKQIALLFDVSVDYLIDMPTGGTHTDITKKSITAHSQQEKRLKDSYRDNPSARI